MGREIRRVPPHWEHPKWTKEDAIRHSLIGELRPCHDRTFKEEAQEWKRSFDQWETKTHSDLKQHDDAAKYEFWEWHGRPPDRECFRPEYTEEPTWWVVYETVTEGTPCTPSFSTPEELIDHLAEHGTTGDAPMSREAAKLFVKDGWVPSMTIDSKGVRSGLESLEE